MIRKIFFSIIFLAVFSTARANGITEIYLVGKACEAGSDNSKALALTPVGNGIFTWTGTLKTDQFKFLVNGKNDDNRINAKTKNERIVLGKEHSWNHVTDNNGNDNHFMMWNAGVFIITLDINNQTLVVELESPPFTGEDFWITGSAVPGDAPIKLEKGALSERFVYNGTLLNGELKIINTADITGKTRYCIPVNEDENLLGTRLPAQTVADVSIPGWKVDYAMENDLYKFYFDIKDYSITAKKFVEPNALFLVGGATTAGWNNYYPIPFVKDTENPYTYTLYTRLRINDQGEERDLFKILLQTEWQPHSYHPPTPNESITGARRFVQNLNDNKWIVTKKDEGDYLIIINVWEETIRFWKDGIITSITTPQNPLQLYFYSENGTVKIKHDGTVSLQNFKLFDLQGNIIVSIAEIGTEDTIARHLPMGIYIGSYFSGGNQYTAKIIVR